MTAELALAVRRRLWLLSGQNGDAGCSALTASTMLTAITPQRSTSLV